MNSWKSDLLILGIISPIIGALAQRYLTQDGSMTINLTSFEWIAIIISLTCLGLWIYFKKSRKQPQKPSEDQKTNSVDSKLLEESRKEIEELKKNPEIRPYKKMDSSEDFLIGARQVCALGITMSSLSDLHVHKVRELINTKNTHFMILLPNKDSIHIKNSQNTGIITDLSANDIPTQIERLDNLRKSLYSQKRQNLQIRIFNLPLLHSMLIVNPHDEDGYMTVSLYDYNTPASNRPEIFLTKKNNPVLFDGFFKSYQFVEQNSIDHKFFD